MRKQQFIKIIQDPANQEHVQEMRQEAAIQGVQEYLLHIYSLPRLKRIRYVVNVLCIKQTVKNEGSAEENTEKEI